MILILDNYDSFTYNIAQYVGAETRVVVKRNDELGLDAVRRLRPAGIVISPGPGHPGRTEDFGVCGPVIQELAATVPILGVCLGHQGIVHHLGGSVSHARRPLHGKVSSVHHDGRGVFRGVANPVDVVRYHSLIAQPANVPSALDVTAKAGDEIMGVRHRHHPLEGVQFHPESIGTQDGRRMIRNFVRTARGR